MKIKSISQTDISNDGKYAAYVVREAIMEEKKSEYLNQIWVTNLVTKENYQYTYNLKSSMSPKFSPDGKKIAFLSSRSGKNQVWIMNTHGGEARKLTNEKKGVRSIKWSPDGKKISFLKNDDDTEEEKKSKENKTDVILVDKNFKYSHIYTYNLDEDSVFQITNGDFSVNNFDYSPDGKKIIFSHQEDTNINTGFVNTDISIIESNGKNIKFLIQRPGLDSNPIFSGDGNKFAFISSGGKQESIGLRDVYIYNLKSDEIKKLSNTPNRDSNIISWSSDDKNLIINESIKTTSQLLLLPVNGDPYTSWSSKKYKEGVISSVVKSKKSDKIIFCYEKLDSPVEVYITKSNEPSFIKLTNINNYDLPKLSRTELITWKSSDGLEIEGILTYPKDYKKGIKYPVILQIHGGPAGVFSQRFNGRPGIYMTEYFSEKGYVTIKPNPRGSTGYGKDFRYANYKDWGYGDYEDVVSGVDKVIEMGIGDPNNQFVMGWSYGGYLTSFIVTKTNRFKAASMGAGLPNLISMVTTTDIQDYLVAHMGSEFWNDYETYEKHSAIYQIKNTSTPTQIIHGANDLRVPFTQGQEFYRALDRLGVDTEMVVYPRTPHGPREPKFLMDVSDRILTWFEKYK
ncbi:MAG: S9 family peptidase [Bacteroidota bacterium]|nr:S9 family peptidase [Bacteroidota bacterium]